MTIIDHILLLILVLVKPVDSAVSYRRYVAAVKAGKQQDTAGVYRSTMIWQWVALAVLAAAWVLLGRPAADLGLVRPGGVGFIVGVALVALLAGVLVYSWRHVARMTAEARARTVESMGDLVYFLPRNEREFRLFAGLSVTAGVVEEIFYRGFLIWYLAQIVPLWAAVVVSSLIFGLGHSYQGVGGVLRTGGVGLGAAVLYVVSGSIWLPMIAHILLDLLQGKMVLEILDEH